MYGKRHGKGPYTYHDGGKYDGEWVDDKVRSFVYLIARAAGCGLSPSALPRTDPRPGRARVRHRQQGARPPKLLPTRAHLPQRPLRASHRNEEGQRL